MTNRVSMLSGWGNYPKITAEIIEPENVPALQETVRKANVILPRGLGRSYGDAALAGTVLSLGRLNRIERFDDKNGVLTAEAGVSIEEILKTIIPRGWFLPVTPGTKHVTLGGAIACDVHGKNHHVEGTFGDNVIEMDVVNADGSITICSRTKLPELFHAIIGGMGLVGIVVRATISLKSIETSFISQTIVRTKNFEETINVLERKKNVTYAITWIDSTARGKNFGRGVVILGEHAPAAILPAGTNPCPVSRKKPLSVFFSLPRFALGTPTAKMFNTAYYNTHPSGKSLVSYDTFFYPLDGISNWNRLYGRWGLFEYQCVVPKNGGAEAIRHLLETAAKSGCPAFLIGLKTFGKLNDNLLSFPMEGYTLAFNFPMREKSFSLFAMLDEIVMRAGGRIYLAKDARLSKAVFDAGYPRAEEFRKYKRQIDPGNKFRSLQSMRLGLY